MTIPPRNQLTYQLINFGLTKFCIKNAQSFIKISMKNDANQIILTNKII